MGKQLKSKLNMETIETFVTEVVYDINEDVSDSKLLSDISKNLSDSVSIKQNIRYTREIKNQTYII